MYSPILTGVQNGRISFWENGRIFIENVLLKLNLKDDGHLDANFLISILTIYRKCSLFQLFSLGIRFHISVLKEVQKRLVSG